MTEAFVQIDYGASDQEVRALEELFRSVDIEAEIKAGVLDLSEATPWVLIIVVSWMPFVKRLAELAAEDAYVALKDFVRRARDARRFSEAPDGTIELDDTDSAVSVKGLTPSLPDEAYRSLLKLDLGALPSGFLGWDPYEGAWIHNSPEGRRRLT